MTPGVVALPISVAGAGVLAWVGRRSPSAASALRLALAGLLAVSEATLLLWPLLARTWAASSTLPLQLSDLATILMIGALVGGRSSRLAGVAYLMAVPSALLALAFPAPGAVPPSPLYYAFWVDHASLLAGAMVIGAARPGPSVGWGMVVWAWLATASLASVDGVVNLATGGDYMFLRRPPAGWDPLRIMGPWPLYVLVAFLICPVILALAELPAWGLQGAQRRTENAGKDRPKTADEAPQRRDGCG
jgi:hypothetical integral membrane protein (TIGR02206 family)